MILQTFCYIYAIPLLDLEHILDHIYNTLHIKQGTEHFAGRIAQTQNSILIKDLFQLGELGRN